MLVGGWGGAGGREREKGRGKRKILRECREMEEWGIEERVKKGGRRSHRLLVGGGRVMGEEGGERNAGRGDKKDCGDVEIERERQEREKEISREE